MAKQDTLQRAKERYADALDEMQETHARIVEDLRFSNPAKPEQWPGDILQSRGSRPAYTFDRCNQFIQQVVNDARQNKPSIDVIPADSVADPEVADHLGGMIRHVEYVSRAGIAYDTAIELSARCGLGWLRAVPEVMRAETNEQEARILRVHDPLGCLLEAGWTQPDGSDALVGWAQTWMPRRAFVKQYPNASTSASWIDQRGIWTRNRGDLILVVEEFEITEQEKNYLECVLPDGSTRNLCEEDYWRFSQELGFAPQVVRQYKAKDRDQKWRKMTGAEVLDETDFPSRFLPIIPVLGYETWVEGERFICGLTRRLMDGQRLHNYEMTAWAEAMASQPKAPFLVPGEAVSGYEEHWQRLATGNPAYLPYAHVDADGNPLPAPSRLSPPLMPAALAQGAVMASQEMEAAVGMFKANLGQSGNETSGRAINARKIEGDTATFHFIDNLARSIEQLGRVVVDMIPRLYDKRRRALVLGLNGEQSFVDVNPKMPEGARKQGGKVVAINPNVGAYDVRVKVGPSFSTQRQETAAQLSEILRSSPDMMAVLGPMWARLQDFPEADKLAKTLLAIAPAPIQALEDEDKGEPQIPPQLKAQMQQMQQALEQMGGALEQASARVQELEAKSQQEGRKLEIEAYKAETERAQVFRESMTPQDVQALVVQMLQQMMAQPDPLPDMPPDMPPGMQMMNEPPPGGFSLPEQGMQMPMQGMQVPPQGPDLAQAAAMQFPTE
jgi:hypothetical protein